MSAADFSRSPELPPIGKPGKPIRAMAFSGGGFSTALQLGVTHALVVMRGEPPDVVAGISAGAVHATALAEVMKAGETAANDEIRLFKQIKAFSLFLEEELSAPSRIASLLLPDAYQVESRAPLEPLEIPTQSGTQRQHRLAGVSSRVELIDLANNMVDLRIKIGDATRLVRAYLGYIAAGEASTAASRRWHEFKALVWLAVAGFRSLVPLASVTRFLWFPVTKSLLRRARILRRTPKKGQSAGQIMFRFRIIDQVKGVLAWIPALVINAALWLLLIVLAVLKLVAAGWAVLRQAIWPARLGGETRPAGPTPSRKASPIATFIQFVFREVLRERNLHGSLLEPEILRAWYVRMFDPAYYGVIDEKEMDAAIDRAIRHPRQASERSPKPRTVGRYNDGPFPIHVGMTVANLRTGKVEILPPETPVVDGLLAATANVPLFEVQPLLVNGTTQWYADALNLSNEPTQAIIDFLKARAHPDATKVLVYPVSHLPFTSPELPGEVSEYQTWVDVALRATDLKRFRDARMEWQLTRLHSRLLPPGKALYELRDGSSDGPTPFILADIHPIEPDQTQTIVRDLFRAEGELARRNVILTAIAEGCRATLEAVTRTAIVSTASQGTNPHGEPAAPCWEVIKTRLGHRSQVPTATADIGPGLPEICRHCSCQVKQHGPGAFKTIKAYVRAREKESPPGPDWPLGSWMGKTVQESRPAAPEQKTESHGKTPGELLPELTDWPRRKTVGDETVDGRSRPLVALLFSGGVFRGVFLLGVVNALNEAGVEPDVIAGASVGSMTAVMVAEVFSKKGEAERSRQLARFASVFMNLDRLILTDGFADFVRTFTVRAAQSRFSLRDVDRVLRRYDEAEDGMYEGELRRVMAGLERLLYLTPFDLREMAQAARKGRNRDLSDLIRRQLDRWLRRDNAHEEILGSETLVRILDAYVFQNHYQSPADCYDVPFQEFLQDGIYLLATATNLSRGRLEILGDVFSRYRDRDPRPALPPSLLEGILASSAFPGIFRPRKSREVFRGAGNTDQYTDGGVMDNLPLDAVARFIHSAAEEGHIASRPVLNLNGTTRSVPHLLFTASLEVDPRPMTPDQMPPLQRDWRNALSRSRQLGYNRKISSYQSAQHNLRRLYDARRAAEPSAVLPYEPSDLEVVDVKPNWLCSTFAFHPMMGFRRQRQAESIAHGCARTFLRLQEIERDKEGQARLQGWGIKTDRIEGVGRGTDTKPRTDVPVETGECVFRLKALCPFSRPSLNKLGLLPDARGQLEEVYYACRRWETHEGHEN